MEKPILSFSLGVLLSIQHGTTLTTSWRASSAALMSAT